GVLGFQPLEPAHQRVVFGVGDLGSVEDVVLLFVVAELFGELLDLGRGIFHWPLIYNLTRDRSPYHYNLQEYRTHLQPPGGQGHTELRRTDPACGVNSQTARAQRHGGADHGAEHGGGAGARARERRGGPDRSGGRRRHHQRGGGRHDRQRGAAGQIAGGYGERAGHGDEAGRKPGEGRPPVG